MRTLSCILALCLAISGAATAPTADETKAPEREPRRTDLLGDPLPPGAVARLGTLRFRHERPIEAIAFSPDGKTVATGHS
ncbi:MAG: WD40 domain-containing protein, partial [Gemmataceae bacterium]|nr:WD40 domain-containing protein [Gemmataceae bacterium]